MHAKIEKIALESGIALGNNVAEGSRRELLNKFALSIVKECADIALREDHDPYECILKEFGVGSMNARMKELMIQAMMDAGRDSVEKTYQRFGELMVRECMYVIGLEVDYFNRQEQFGEEMGAGWARTTIARHFGVEK
jgi:hypothetical protein